MAARMLYAYTLSPLHCGTGTSAEVIDLPIAREKVTAWPIIPGSSVKGPLKERLKREPGEQDYARWRAAFGPETDAAEDGAGALAFGDARLLCFPARSYAGSFAWLTCPLALRRWKRDHTASGQALEVAIPDGPPTGTLLVTQGTRLAVGSQVLLEDLDFKAQESTGVTQLAGLLGQIIFEDVEWRGMFQRQLAIASDDVFSFLTETATEVAARIRLDSETKTAQRGALWYEEAVPPEAVFSGPIIDLARSGPSGREHLSLLPPALTLQMGGHASIGRGLVRLTLTEGGA